MRRCFQYSQTTTTTCRRQTTRSGRIQYCIVQFVVTVILEEPFPPTFLFFPSGSDGDKRKVGGRVSSKENEKRITGASARKAALNNCSVNISMASRSIFTPRQSHLLLLFASIFIVTGKRTQVIRNVEAFSNRRTRSETQTRARTIAEVICQDIRT